MPTSIASGGYTNSNFWLMVGAPLLVSPRGRPDPVAVWWPSYKRVSLLDLGRRRRASFAHAIGHRTCTLFIPVMAGIVEAYGATSTSKFAASLLLHI
jgi:hypothetical protein